MMMEQRLLVELSPTGALSHLAEGLAVKLKEGDTNSLKLIQQHSLDLCSYNWIATGTSLMAVCLTTYSDDILCRMKNLQLDYVETDNDLITIWLSAEREGEHLIVQDWDVYFIERSDGRIIMDLSLWQLPPALYQRF